MRKSIVLLIILITACPCLANWRVYSEDKNIVASFDDLSRASFQGKPSLWVRWHYVHPENGVGGVKIQFTAHCAQHRLYEINSDPYDTERNFLGLIRREDAPREYPVTPGSLNEATYKLMCP